MRSLVYAIVDPLNPFEVLHITESEKSTSDTFSDASFHRFVSSEFLVNTLTKVDWVAFEQLR